MSQFAVSFQDLWIEVLLQLLFVHNHVFLSAFLRNAKEKKERKSTWNHQRRVTSVSAISLPWFDECPEGFEDKWRVYEQTNSQAFWIVFERDLLEFHSGLYGLHVKVALGETVQIDDDTETVSFCATFDGFFEDPDDVADKFVNVLVLGIVVFHFDQTYRSSRRTRKTS